MVTMRKSISEGKMLWLGIVAMLLLLLSACGGSDNEKNAATPEHVSTPTPTTATAPSESPPPDNAVPDADLAKQVTDTPTELMIWGMGGQPNDAAEIATKQSKLIEKFPNFKFTFTGNAKVDELIATNRVPDIMISKQPESYIYKYELQSDISDLIKKYNFDLSVIEPSLLVNLKNVGGKDGLFGLPVYGSPLSFVYNKDLFDKFNVPYPTDDMTWDDLYDLAVQMTRKVEGQQYQGTSITLWSNLWYNQLGIPLVDPVTNKSNLSSDEFRKLFLNFARFFLIPDNDPPSKTYPNENETEDLFLKEKTSAMSFNTMGQIVNAIKGGMNIDVAAMPVYSGMEAGTGTLNPYSVYITSTSKNRDAAFQVIAYLFSEEMQQFIVSDDPYAMTALVDKGSMENFGQSPSYQGQQLNFESLIPKVLVPPAMASIYDPLARGELNKALHDYLYGGVDAVTALKAAAERVDLAIAMQQGK